LPAPDYNEGCIRLQEVEISPYMGAKTGCLQTALDHAVVVTLSAET
jgi:hypothetical protein